MRSSHGPWLTPAVTDVDAAKRPKLENHLSTGSSGTVSSASSQHGRDTPTGRMPVDSSPASASQWHEGHHPPALTLPVVQPGQSHGSPSSPSSILSSYRGAIFGGSAQSLPWRESNREERNMPLQQRRRVASIGDRPLGYAPPPAGDPLNLTEALQNTHRLGQGAYPPSTSASGSSHSTASSSFLTPRTPLEPTLDRALPMPSLFPQTSSGCYDKQLPPLRASSLSPQSGTHGLQQSPKSTLRKGQV